jgi:hypothetical protein
MTRILVFLALIATPPFREPTTVKVLSQAVRTKQMQALKDGQPVSVEMQTVRISVGLPNGKQTEAYVLMLREPKSGLYWWTYQGVAANASGGASPEPSLDYVVYFSDTKAVGFSFFTPFLAMREVQGKKPDFASIQQTATAEIEGNAQAIQDGSMQWVREVNVSSKIGRDFLFPGGSASIFPKPKVTAVNHSNDRWDITLEGPNHDFAQLTLDDRYALLNARREKTNR